MCCSPSFDFHTKLAVRLFYTWEHIEKCLHTPVRPFVPVACAQTSIHVQCSSETQCFVVWSAIEMLSIAAMAKEARRRGRTPTLEIHSEKIRGDIKLGLSETNMCGKSANYLLLLSALRRRLGISADGNWLMVFSAKFHLLKCAPSDVEVCWLHLNLFSLITTSVFLEFALQNYKLYTFFSLHLLLLLLFFIFISNWPYIFFSDIKLLRIENFELHTKKIHCTASYISRRWRNNCVIWF